MTHQERLEALPGWIMSQYGVDPYITKLVQKHLHEGTSREEFIEETAKVMFDLFSQTMKRLVEEIESKPMPPIFMMPNEKTPHP